MTLDEAIKHAEEAMVENLEKTKGMNASDPVAAYCSECAEELRQLAEWLKELKRLREQTEPERKTGHCKGCKYFEYDSVAKVDGIPLIVAHEICNRWGNGCKTKEDGYCFLYEPQESEDNNGIKHRENGTAGC